ncbi:unnamed protein product [Zymoseptoria tritici ST99CH_3D7]|uniref:Uncharacterized protein n=1 Tax=Zymoseptoria tritici (strain ST99CH_3D7) TaxID=1276538 RepID=A0A1X7RIT4_ZYMT9|nr:unnamed protein product [Zymoseptoria tritici ST99CH_3D7]
MRSRQVTSIQLVPLAVKRAPYLHSTLCSSKTFTKTYSAQSGSVLFSREVIPRHHVRKPSVYSGWTRSKRQEHRTRCLRCRS